MGGAGARERCVAPPARGRACDDTSGPIAHQSSACSQASMVVWARGSVGLMISRRNLLGGLAALSAPALAGCSGGRPPTGAGFAAPSTMPYAGADGLDAVIDISSNVSVTDFAAVRRSGILGVIHKVSEGGDWFDPAYAQRRHQAETAGLFWGGYHFGTGH